ncbi:MAG: hypothetical protein IT289_13395 [Oligoflexia bacterium]|nr:hypothetical protein [Oligoflexia bacterium]
MKKLMTIKFWALGLSLIIGTAGCSMSGKKLNDYPTQELDRPYTLPDGIKSYEIWTFTGISGQTGAVGIYPFIWQQSLSDNFTLVWTPLPLGLRYQILRTENHTLGVTGVYLLLGGIGSLDYKFKFSENMGVVLQASYLVFDFPLLYKYESNNYSGGLMIQITDKWSLTPTYTRSKVTVRARFFEWFVSALTLNTINLDTTTDFFTNTYTLRNLISLGRQWDLGLDIGAVTLDGYTSKAALSGSFKFVHYWD